MSDDEETTPDLIISHGDCELFGRCECGTPLGSIKPDQSLDVLGQAWERHVMVSGDCALHAPVTPPGSTRRLPAPAQACERCGAQIVWARTMAGPNGAGGKAMPLDQHENPRGNVAVLPGVVGQLRARVLGKDEHHAPPVEYLAMPHFATCRRT